MTLDGELRARIERAIREELQCRFRTDLREAELKSRLAAAVEAIAEIAANIRADRAYHQTPAFGFAETAGQPFGWGAFGEAAEAWAEPDREHAFRKISRAETEKQLQALAAAREATIKALDCLSEPALLLLAHEGISINQERKGETDKIKKIEEVLAANLKYVPGKQGRQAVKQAEQKLAAVLAEAYFDLTAKRPGRSRRSNEKKLGSFHLFADCMFAAIGLEPPSDFVVKAARNFVAKKSPI
jgi:hypothetical protein